MLGVYLKVNAKIGPFLYKNYSQIVHFDWHTIRRTNLRRKRNTSNMAAFSIADRTTLRSPHVLHMSCTVATEFRTL